MSTRPLALVALVLAASLSLVGCKKKAGDKCTGSVASCSDPTTAFVCENDVLRALPCRGPTGCSTKGNMIGCDTAVAMAGDECNIKGDIACATDHKAALSCDDGKFTVIETCKGVGGCTLKEDKINCDNNVSDLADPCHRNGDYACTTDKAMLMKCADNKFGPLNSCRGPDGCRIKELPEEHKTEFVCDDTIAQENDPCEGSDEAACSVDKKSLLTCQGSKFVTAKPCSGGCSYDEKQRQLLCATDKGVVSTSKAKSDHSSAPGSSAAHGAPAGAAKPAAAASGSAGPKVPAAASASAAPKIPAAASAGAKPPAAASAAGKTPKPAIIAAPATSAKKK